MKKLLTLLIALVAALSVFGAGCKIAGSSVDPADLDKAKTRLELDMNKIPEITSADYKVPTQIVISGTDYRVVWTTDVTEGVTIGTEKDENLKITIDVNEETSVAIPYVLTATIYDPNDNNVVVSYNKTIPQYVEATWEDYVTAAKANKGENINVKGVVTGIMSKTKENKNNCLYVQDLENKGAYYVYNLTDDPVELGIQIGMTVRVNGNAISYSGTYELEKATVKIVDETIKTVEAADYTAAYTAATSLKDDALVAAQGLLVTIKGVELEPQSAADVDGGYYRFKLGNLSSYLRISSSVCPLDKDEQKTFIDTFNANIANKADVTGVICVYSGQFYLTPVSTSALSNIVVVERTDAEKADLELSAAYLDSYYYDKDATVTLPAPKIFKDVVTFAWASDNACAVVEGNTLTITAPETMTAVKVTLTATCGTEVKTKEFNLKVIKLNPEDEAAILNAALTLAEGEAFGGEYSLTGVIKTINTAYSSQYKNITVTITLNADATQAMQCYRLAGGEELKVGDEIKVTGIINRKGSIQFNAGAKYEMIKAADPTPVDPVDPVDPTVPTDPVEILNAAYALASGESLAYQPTLTGVITSIDTPYDAGYGNITVTIVVANVTDKPIKCYRLVGGQELAVNDTITVTGTVKNYSGTVEFDQKCTYKDRVAGISTISVGVTSSANATVTIKDNQTQGENGTVFTFTVTVADGYELVAVKVNGVEVTATEAVYTGTIAGNTTILVETKQEGVVDTNTTVSKTIAELAKQYTWNDSNVKQTEFALDDVVTCNVAGGNNSGKVYNSDNMRLYATDTPAGTLTISVKEGYTLVSIEITCQTGTYADLQLNGTSVVNTSTAVSGSSVELTSVKVGSDGKQVRITAIKVVYTTKA